MKRVAWVVVALVAGVAALTWWWSPRRTAAPATPNASVAAAPDAARSTALPKLEDVPLAPTEGEPRADVRESVPEPPTVAVAREKLSPQTARLRVTVRAKEDSTPLAHVTVVALRPNTGVFIAPLEGSRGKLGEAPVTGADGIAEVEVEPGIALTLMLMPNKSRSDYRNVEPIEAGATFEMIVELPMREDVRFFGRLVDGEDRHALIGRVRFVNGNRRAQTVETDDNGLFALDAASWDRPVMETEVEAYARATFPATAGYEDASKPFVVMLLRAATVDVIVRDGARLPISEATVVLGTEGYRIAQRGLSMFDGGVGNDPIWNVRTAPDGRVTIGNLPARVPLKVSVAARGGPKRDEPQPIMLEPGERRAIELWLGTGTTVRGLLEDQHGTPIAACEVWRAVAEGDVSGMFEDVQECAAKTTTNEAGRFTFADVPAGKWWIGPAPSDSSEDVPWDGVAPFAQLVEIAESPVELAIVVRASRDLYVTGRVLDPAGEPAKNCEVSVQGLEIYAFANKTTDEKGKFSIGPLAAGRWLMQADMEGSGEQAPSDTLEVEAGTSDIVLQLRAGAGISGEVVDAASGKRCECDVGLAHDDPTDRGWTMTRSDDGMFSLGGLVPRTYVVTARTPGGKCGVSGRLTLAPGVKLDGVRIEVRPGATLQLRYAGPAKYVMCHILVDGLLVYGTSVEARETEAVVLPLGQVEVRWFEGAISDFEHSVKLTLAAGETRTLDLVPGG